MRALQIQKAIVVTTATQQWDALNINGYNHSNYKYVEVFVKTSVIYSFSFFHFIWSLSEISEFRWVLSLRWQFNIFPVVVLGFRYTTFIELKNESKQAAVNISQEGGHIWHLFSIDDDDIHFYNWLCLLDVYSIVDL